MQVVVLSELALDGGNIFFSNSGHVLEEQGITWKIA